MATKRMPEALKSFVEQGRKNVENWVPEVGDEVYGTVVNRSKGTFTVDGRTLEAVFTELDCGEPTNKRLAWFGTVLIQQERHHQPDNGDMVYVRRLPDVERKNPREGEDSTYANFRVMVQKNLLPSD